MLRENRVEEVSSDHISEVASAIAEEGLRYVSVAGYRRKRTGTSFTYYDKDGKRITDKAVIRRIKSDPTRARKAGAEARGDRTRRPAVRLHG